MTYLSPLKRPGNSFFFTVLLADTASDALTTHVEVLRAAVRHTRAEHPFNIDAWVTLPDHIHCIWQLPMDDTDYAIRWSKIMARFAMALKQDQHCTKPIWQRRYWGHPIVGWRNHQRLMRYCWMNPVKHGLVDHPEQWAHSSWHRDRLDQLSDGCGVLSSGATSQPTEQNYAL